jgi:hypothetical protein
MLIKHVSLVTMTLLLATPVSARIMGTDLAAMNSTNSSTWIELAQTRAKENRDARQGDRDDWQDTRGGCREAEGVGKDKRDCKQDGRQDRNGH